MTRNPRFITRERRRFGTVAACFAAASLTLMAQSGAAQSATGDTAAIERRIDDLTAVLSATQAQLAQSQRELAALRAELAGVERQGHAAPVVPLEDQAEVADKLERQGEQQEVLQAEIEQHEQTKVETESKFPLKVHGLILFNAFLNAGVVDNPDLPTVAFPRQPGASHGSAGASIRQTLLGIHATGPHLGGASTAADVSADFFGGLSYNLYGSTTGNFRLRTADVSATWKRDALHLGVDSPLISPVSPTSYATVATPSLAWAGNLWTWAPQVRYEHRFKVSDAGNLQFEGGLLDLPVVDVQQQSAYRILSAGELSRRPAVEARASYHLRLFDRDLSVGVGEYKARESYNGGVNIGTWAVTSDWQLPLARHVQVDGEFYRGAGLGSLGGGAYKDVLVGLDPSTGLPRTLALNAVGGWSQLTLHVNRTLDANVSAGQDAGYASEMHGLTLSDASNPLETLARTRMMVGNLVFRPRTYLIFSPEFRRITNWQLTGAPNVANLFTLTAGYQF